MARLFDDGAGNDDLDQEIDDDISDEFDEDEDGGSLVAKFM